MKCPKLLVCLVLVCAGCGGSSGNGGNGGNGGTFTFFVDGSAEDYSSGTSQISEFSTTGPDGSPFNAGRIVGTNSSFTANVTLYVPVWPLTVGAWSCPDDYEADILYGVFASGSSDDAYYVGQNGEVNPNSANAPCTITITAVGSTVSGTFSGTLGDGSGKTATFTNGVFSLPGS